MTAHLDMDTHAGQAWVGLRVMLGPSSIHQDQRHPPARKNRSPSYYRRQARRKAARETINAELNAEEAETKATDNQVAEAKDAEIASEALEETENVSEDNKEADKASKILTKNFKCELCDFESNREAGYKIHMTRKHATIEQLDGNIEEVDDSRISDWHEMLERYDDFIEKYLMAGELSEFNIEAI